MRKKLLISFLLISFFGFTQSDNVFIENKGQWDSRIEYNQILADGNLFLEKDGFTYSLFDKSYINSLHHDKTTQRPDVIKSHAVKTKFLNANSTVTLKQLDTSSFYFNYFLGDDESKWKSYVRSSSKIAYQELYDDIDLVIYHESGATKYDFIVKPNGNPNNIQVNYLGADSVFLNEGKLVIKNTISDFEEAKPYSYQLVGGKKVEVPCSYQLNGTILSFDFPDGYDTTKELVIDPIVVFSSFTGSTADNFGFTATYDNDENTYVGGIVYGQGVYPTTVGAFQTSFNTSVWYYVDIAVSKFNVNGTNLLYSTYIGGGRSEAPHSLVVNDNDELFVMGTSGSLDYPITIGAYDSVFSGGASVSPLYSGIYYFNGSDIIVTKLNATGSALMGSTYVGGTGNDGVNSDPMLSYNYGDGFRGEIVVDSLGNALIVSTTNSNNFPVTVGAPQSNYGGGYSDACVFRLNPNLTNLTWSTYHGGANQDAGYGLQYDSRGDVFITGGTRSANIVTSVSAYDRTYNGLEDGFIAKFNLSTNTLAASTYIGTSNYDQSYFVQLDLNDDVYITGQSLGSYPVTPTVYANPGSKQFFHKLSNDLDSSYWSTVVGSGRNAVDFSPSAFLINDCGLIYLSGWGGVTNNFYRPTASSTAGLPLTADAFQLTTDGSDFYLMVLDKDASGIRYGTYYGGNVSHEHVDGGTSRFDKKGNVYQAVCAGCGGHSDLPTTPGAWSRTNNSTNCNLGVIKMNIAYINTIASLPVPFICLPDSVNFINNSSGGNTYKWYFGDGDSSSAFEPTHVYPDTGTYFVTLIVSDSTGCVPPDTAVVRVDAYKPKSLAIDTVPIICLGDSVQLMARNGQSYKWSPASTLSNDSIPNPIAFPLATTTYQLISDYYCNSDTLYVTIVVDSVNGTIKPDTTVCEGTTINLWATGGGTYNWYPTTGMTNSTSSTPTVTVSAPMYYYVDVTSVNGCMYTDSIYIDLHNDVMSISPDTSICIGQSVGLTSTGGGSYSWTPATTLTSSTLSNPIATPLTTTTYQLSVISPNGCQLSDSVTVTVFDDAHTITPDTATCPGGTVQLNVTGGGTYSWNPHPSIIGGTTSSPLVQPTSVTQYQVAIVSPNGCPLYDTVTVSIHIDTVTIKPDTTVCEGTTINLWATGGGTYNWYPTTGMTNATSSTPTVTVSTPMYYYVDVTSVNGCVYTDSIYIDLHNDVMSISPDTSICTGQSVGLTSTGGGSYSWTPATTLTSSTLSNPTATPLATTTYQLTVVSPNGCQLSDSVTVTVFDDAHTITPDTATCPGGTVQLNVTGGGTYSWNPHPSIIGGTTSSPLVQPTSVTQYQVAIVSPNGCPLYDTVTVSIHIDTVTIKPDTTVCEGTTINLWATGGGTYNWYPTTGMTNATSSTPTVTVSTPMYYYVDVTSVNGCVYTDSIYIDLHNDAMRISPDTSICLGQSVTLNSVGGGSYSWTPASTLSNSSISNPIATPLTTTTYQLAVISPNGCLLSDSVTVTLFNDVMSISPDTSICPGSSLTLFSSGGGTYLWQNDPSLSGVTLSNPTVSPTRSTQYQLLVTSPNGCLLRDSVTVDIHDELTGTGPDTSICAGDTVQISAFGGASYSWSPSTTLSNSTVSSPFAFPTLSTNYRLTITTPKGCVKYDSVNVVIDTNRVYPIITNDTIICGASSGIVLNASGGTSYSWSPALLVSFPNSATTMASPVRNTTFYVDISNRCFTARDSVHVTVAGSNSIIIPDDTICKGEITTIVASGAISYQWEADNSILSGLNSSTLTVQPDQPTYYTLHVIDGYGCKDSTTVFVDLHAESNIFAGSNVIIPLGETALLNATGDAGSIVWTPSSTLNCDTCRLVQAFPEVTTMYAVELTDLNGCKTADSVLVEIGGILRVPNTFTPNGDGINDVFYAVGLNITGFRMEVFNRWGQLIFVSTDIDQGWDGTFAGADCKVDTYVWKVTYSHLTEQRDQLMGHVNIVK